VLFPGPLMVTQPFIISLTVMEPEDSLLLSQKSSIYPHNLFLKKSCSYYLPIYNKVFLMFFPLECMS